MNRLILVQTVFFSVLSQANGQIGAPTQHLDFEITKPHAAFDIARLRGKPGQDPKLVRACVRMDSELYRVERGLEKGLLSLTEKVEAYHQSIQQSFDKRNCQDVLIHSFALANRRLSESIKSRQLSGEYSYSLTSEQRRLLIQKFLEDQIIPDRYE